jgi:hydroxymethylbilane synthase
LALWQARHVAGLLEARGYKTSLTIIKTQGDLVQDRFLHEIGGKGLFIKELEASLLKKETDIAVHSLKDLPARVKAPFHLAALLKRHSPRDVLITKPSWTNNRAWGKGLITREEAREWQGVRLATASLRRQALIKRNIPGAILEPVRGNVDTRIEKLKTGNWDGLILAGASLERLGLTELPARELDESWFIPAPGQGALAIEALEDCSFLPVIQALGSEETRAHVTTEREVLGLLGGDCTMPFGCHVFFDAAQNLTTARAIVLDGESGAAQCHRQRPGPHSAWSVQELAQDLFQGLMADGADKILNRLRITIPDLGKL